MMSGPIIRQLCWEETEKQTNLMNFTGFLYVGICDVVGSKPGSARKIFTDSN